MALEAFVQGIHPERLGERLSAHCSLSAALAEAERVENIEALWSRGIVYARHRWKKTGRSWRRRDRPQYNHHNAAHASGRGRPAKTDATGVASRDTSRPSQTRRRWHGGREFHYLPGYGLHTAGPALPNKRTLCGLNFERLMERVLVGIPRTCCVVYLDDILCHATDFTGAREVLAVVMAVRHFQTYLYGKWFLLRTDHASLTWLLNFKEPEGQLARWLKALRDYDMEIQHRAGRLHGNADALSRRPCAADQCQHSHRREERSLATAQPEPARRLQAASPLAERERAAAFNARQQQASERLTAHQRHASERLTARQRRANKRATTRQLHASERVNPRQQHPEVVSPPSTVSYSDQETRDSPPQPNATTQHCRVAAGATDAQAPVDVMSREEIWKAQSEDATLSRRHTHLHSKEGPHTTLARSAAAIFSRGSHGAGSCRCHGPTASHRAGKSLRARSHGLLH
ncbi:uncharacterized protein LOC121694287 [Alosa sapidissima]|uniref:uncharacterized protein LOC121694287 n=1 Tax=Alosa sapidissima TaxID=34773 RepID=UPI001C08F7D9|nr:uncharacterized protein LOC121694287 [Alosa sapidissima]XP_041930312.1 uncharacterized protein LOC121694287 [Alosa sapidissima]XP_041930313.1 uncharacterized protein LOC121694287 [Alosa sapidissima]